MSKNWPKLVRVQNNHIRRLQERNKALAEMLAQERLARKRAYQHLRGARRDYEGRLASRFMWLFDYFYLTSKYLKRSGE